MSHAGPMHGLLAALAIGLGGCSSPVASSPVASSSPASLPPASSDAAASGWTKLRDAPFARLEMATAAHDGRIWLAGGLSPLGEALDEVDIFDPASGTWTDGPSLPASVHHAALVSDGDRLLLIGGYLGSAFNRPSDLVLELTGETGEWSEIEPLPEPRSAGAAAFDGERVVYAGGVGIGEVATEVFALEAGVWQLVGSMAGPREHLAATSDGAGRVWLLGGRVGGLDSNLASVEVVEGATIAEVEPLPTPRGGVAAFFAPGAGACLSGGEAPDGAFATVECVGEDGEVTTLPATLERHHGHGAAVVDGVAYVLLGGPEPGLSASATVESLTIEP